jgi:hypothetical protein
MNECNRIYPGFSDTKLVALLHISLVMWYECNHTLISMWALRGQSSVWAVAAAASNGCMHLEVGLHRACEISHHTHLRYTQLLLYELCGRQKWQPADGRALVTAPLPESSVDGLFQGDYYMGNCSTGSIMPCGQPSSSVISWTGRERRHGTVRFHVPVLWWRGNWHLALYSR